MARPGLTAVHIRPPHTSSGARSPSREEGICWECGIQLMICFGFHFVHCLVPLPPLMLIETSVSHSTQEFKDHRSKANWGSPRSPFYANFSPLRQVVKGSIIFFGGRGVIDLNLSHKKACSVECHESPLCPAAGLPVSRSGASCEGREARGHAGAKGLVAWVPLCSPG